MKIYRGPRTSKSWKVTDTKPARTWATTWRPGAKLLLDGTIKKTGQRHTDLGVEIEADDIIALSNALMRSQKKRIAALNEELAEKTETIELLESAITKIVNLLSFHREQAPSQEELLENIQKIAEHFESSDTRSQKFKLDWIDWDSL